MSPTVSTWVPFDEGTMPEVPCVWCQSPTDIRAKTPFRPDLGAVPLHLFCAAEIIDLYNNRHRILPEHMPRMQRLLESGL